MVSLRLEEAVASVIGTLVWKAKLLIISLSLF